MSELRHDGTMRTDAEVIANAKANYQHLDSAVLRQVVKHNLKKAGTQPRNVDAFLTTSLTAKACAELLAERCAEQTEAT